MPFYMLQRRKAEGCHKLHRLMLLGKLWSLAIFKILGLRVILLRGIIRDRGKQIQKFGWIEVWLMKLG